MVLTFKHISFFSPLITITSILKIMQIENGIIDWHRPLSLLDSWQYWLLLSIVLGQYPITGQLAYKLKVHQVVFYIMIQLCKQSIRWCYKQIHVCVAFSQHCQWKCVKRRSLFLCLSHIQRSTYHRQKCCQANKESHIYTHLHV